MSNDNEPLESLFYPEEALDFTNEPVPSWYVQYSHYDKFFAIACACYAQSRVLARVKSQMPPELQTQEPSQGKGSSMHPDRKNDGIGHPGPAAHEDTTEDGQSERLATVATVFAAITLEAFINSYASARMGADLARSLDRTPIREKWTLFPKLILGVTLDKGHRAYQGLAKLFAVRDAIVHCKPTVELTIGDVHNVEPPRGHLLFEDVRKLDAPTIVREAVKALHELDESVEIDWIRQRTASWEHFL